MNYSIIVPYHSNSNYLHLCLQSLIDTTPNTVEIIVVVNNNSEREFNIDISYDRVKVIRVKQNLGYSKAINLGVENSKGKYLIFSDSDTVYFDKNWFSNLTLFYASKENIGIASSKLINPSTGRIIDFGMALSKYNNAHPFMDRPMDFPPTLKNRRVQMACSANMIIERELFYKLGMIDTDLVNFYQDTDICLKLKDHGKECWVVANSLAYHKGSSSGINRTSYRADIKGYYMAKNFHRMKIDLDNYFRINYDYFKNETECSIKPKYLLVDCSSVADREWFYKVIEQYFPLYETYEMSHPVRDISHISLIDHLGTNILKMNVPIIYFVDRFISLENNSIWEDFRDCSNDIIIDRNANIISYSSVRQ
ncbi:MAG: glycosyltransferase [Bacteroidales bacterium]|jgi:GT2 family glycosyltransferase|nr:glycosyltransferase [Bacteroidales bacterium]